MALGANFILKDQKLSLEPHKWLIPIKEEYPALEAEYLHARTKENPLPSDFSSINESWRAKRDSNCPLT